MKICSVTFENYDCTEEVVLMTSPQIISCHNISAVTTHNCNITVSGGLFTSKFNGKAGRKSDVVPT